MLVLKVPDCEYGRKRLPRTCTMMRSCRSMAVVGHCTCAPSAHRKSYHLAINVRHRGCIGDWGSYTHQLTHTLSPAVPNMAPRRALSHTFSLKCSIHACTFSNASRTTSTTGHAYAGTIELICRASSARKQRSGRARTDDDGVYTVHA